MAGADEERPDVDSDEQVYGLGRLLALSDGVFAFAMTLLVVQLGVPQLAQGEVGQLGSRLLEEVPSYISYLISFVVISMYWYSHHRLFRYVRRWDAWLITLNLGALLFVAVMPFPTAIMGRYADITGVALTDSLGAGAISGAGYSQPAAALTALESGADMVIIHPSQLQAALVALANAVNSGALPLGLVNASVTRILVTKGIAVCAG